MNSIRRHCARALGGAVWIASVLCGLPAVSHAAFSPCMATASGNPSLNCVANDLGVASFHLTSLNESCTGLGDTMTFDGEVNVAAGTTARYDLGFYVGFDSAQALTGNCTVGIIDPDRRECSNNATTCNTNADCTGGGICTLPDLDGDNCGDYPKTTIAVGMTGIVATCRDSNHDGFYDLAICASYDQNANTTCNNSSQAVPGTGSKCQCAQIETDLAVPHCRSAADCDDDGNLCTTEVCNSLQSGLGDLFGCSHDNNTVPCGDGVFCNGPDTCSGGVCTHAGNPCAGGGVCGNACNEDLDNCFVAAGTTCRASAGVCDVREVCTGSTASCPTDAFLSTANACRTSAGICDTAERCTGTSAACPSNAFRLSTTTCRGSSGVCDVAENCTGTSADCPTQAFVSSVTICRDTTGVCDLAERCTGSSGACPSDAVAGTATICRIAAGVCDIDERCDGTGTGCPDDAFVSSAATCRASGGVCDIIERCSGAGAACPADTLESTSTVCRGSTGICDAAETCNGSDASCPLDLLSPSTAICRPAAGECDVAETCDGEGGPCPGDGYKPADAPCTSDDNVCTDDVCDAAGQCLHTDNEDPCDDGLFCTGDDVCVEGTCTHDGNPCAEGDECADNCNEAANTCNEDVSVACTSDDNICTDDHCDGSGVCAHTPNTLPCDDGLFCDGDDNCADGTCTHDGDPCADGPQCQNVCSEENRNCLDTDGNPCDKDCIISGSGVCEDGVCEGEDITLSPSCRWIVLAGVGPSQVSGTVTTTGARYDASSLLDGSVCGFYSFRTRGLATGDLVATSGMGEGHKGVGIKFGTNGDAAGDIVTGQSTVKAGAYQTVPGTGFGTIGSGMLVERLTDLLLPTGTFVDTTGTHDLVDVCKDDQDILGDAATLLDALPATTSLGKLKLKHAGALQLDASGLTVLEYTSFKIGGQATVTLHGDADDVLVIRSLGDLRIGYASHIVLDGLLPENVLFYGRGNRCKVAARVTGSGTWFCPVARKFFFGFGTTWEGTALGGTKEVRVRRHVDFKHKAFKGF